jgi:hypothetical protein
MLIALHLRLSCTSRMHSLQVKPTDVATWLQDAHQATPLQYMATHDGTDQGSSEAELILYRSFTDWRTFMALLGWLLC